MTRLTQPLRFEGRWRVSVLEYSFHAKLPGIGGRPLYILCDLVEPELMSEREERLLYSSALSTKDRQIVRPRYKKVAVDRASTITIKLVDSANNPINCKGTGMLLHLVFVPVVTPNK